MFDFSGFAKDRLEKENQKKGMKIIEQERELIALRKDREIVREYVNQLDAEVTIMKGSMSSFLMERDNLREDNCYLAQTIEKMTEELEKTDREIMECKKEITRQDQILITVLVREHMYHLTCEYLDEYAKQAEHDKKKLAEGCRRLEDENTILSLEKDYIIEGYKEKISSLKKEIAAYSALSGSEEIARLNKENYFLKEELERSRVRRDQAVNSEEALKDTLDMVSGENEALKKVMREDFPVKVMINIDKALVQKNQELMEEKIKLIKEVRKYKSALNDISAVSEEMFYEIFPLSLGTLFAM